MLIAISGATGFIGKALANFLRGRGHDVIALVRDERKKGSRDVLWNPAEEKLDPEALEGIDAFVNLSGESLAVRWTADRKKAIRDSRMQSTTLIARTLASLKRKPSVLISGSAVGYYGANRGDEILDEMSRPGDDFLARICVEWEAATLPAKEAGVRVVNSRCGIVLNPEGGVLEKLMTPFKMGVGGKAGSGDQWISWIARDDLLAAILFAIEQSRVIGPTNITAPNPATNAELAQELGKALHRPAIAPVPAPVLKLMFGSEMAEGTVLASQRVFPKHLIDAGFGFKYPSLEAALRHELNLAPV